jgi:hypothetical protein
MNLKQRTQAFIDTGLFIKRHFDQSTWLEAEKGLHQGLEHLMVVSYTYNGWFIKPFIEEALKNIASMLDAKALADFTKDIEEPARPKTVAIIMAGNIPLVGFHDLLCVLLSGHKALIKLSSDDNVLMPFFVKLLESYAPGLTTHIAYAEGKLENFNAVIATGSNNTAQYFEHYFGKYPNIIRKNRSSAAVLTGRETETDLKNLGRDIFLFFGLGCRNVSKLFVPKNYKFDTLYESVFDFKFVIDNKKYNNNYEYNRAVYLLNLDKFLDNNFLIIKQDKGLHAPVSVVFYEEYENEAQLKAYLDANASELQCIVGSGPNYIPFGYSQQPVITDFADGVNTLKFLVSL